MMQVAPQGLADIGQRGVVVKIQETARQEGDARVVRRKQVPSSRIAEIQPVAAQGADDILGPVDDVPARDIACGVPPYDDAVRVPAFPEAAFVGDGLEGDGVTVGNQGIFGI
jgi:hypothetical protein